LGVDGMQDELCDINLWCNVKRIRRLIRKMCLEPIYPKCILSKIRYSQVHLSLPVQKLSHYPAELGLGDLYYLHTNKVGFYVSHGNNRCL